MTKILNFTLKIKGGGREGWHMQSPPTLPPPKIWNVHPWDDLGKRHFVLGKCHFAPESAFPYLSRGIHFTPIDPSIFVQDFYVKFEHKSCYISLPQKSIQDVSKNYFKKYPYIDDLHINSDHDENGTVDI